MSMHVVPPVSVQDPFPASSFRSKPGFNSNPAGRGIHRRVFKLDSMHSDRECPLGGRVERLRSDPSGTIRIARPVRRFSNAIGQMELESHSTC